MSILIKGMEMPQNCYECKFGLATFYRLYTQDSKGKANCYSCVLTGKQITSTKRNIHCPLVPVPDHGDLIERDDLISFCVRNKTDEWNKQVVTTYAKALDEFEDIVQDAPTIIPADHADKESEE